MLLKILNQTYNIQGAEDEEYMRSLGRYVEDKMKQIQKLTTTIDSHRLAVLTSLQIADDFFQMREKHADLDRFVGRKSAELLKALEPFTEAGNAGRNSCGDGGVSVI